MIISIRHYRFEVRELFDPSRHGDGFDVVACQVLNALRAHALREIWTKRIPPSGVLGEAELVKLHKDFKEFDRNYFLPSPIALRPSHTLEDEMDLMESEGYRGPDLQSLARKRLKVRLGLAEDLKLEEII